MTTTILPTADNLLTKPSPVEAARLLISSDRQPGARAAVDTFLRRRRIDVLHADEYASDLRLYQRHLLSEAGLLPDIEREFAVEVAARYAMDFRFSDATKRKRVALFVSRHNHCLLDLLWRWRRGELPIDIGMVISNHPDLEEQVTAFGVPYAHIPVNPSTVREAECRQLELLGEQVDLVVLARYMRILSGAFLDQLRVPVINIHHSLLPAFVGSRPYERAKQRGVKLIGATAHYVTDQLDAGPIIEQDMVRVTHEDRVEDLIRLGAHLECTVLARAVAWHCEDRVMTDGRTTMVFG